MKTFKISHFLDGNLPSTLLVMPFCFDSISNLSEKQYAEFADICVPDSPKNALKLVRKNRQQPTSDRISYCEKIGAAFALTGPECVYHNATLYLKEESYKWYSSFEFRIHSWVDPRRYAVDRVFARYVKFDGDQFLEVKHSALTGIYVDLRGTGTDGSIDKITATIYLGQEKKVIGPNYDLKFPENFNAYKEFDAQLGGAIDALANGENANQTGERLEKSINQIVGIDHEPIVAFINSLFIPRCGEILEDLVNRLQHLKKRIYDAPFLMHSVLPELNKIARVYFAEKTAIDENYEEVFQEADLEADSDENQARKRRSLYPEVETSRLKLILNHAAFDRLLPELKRTHLNLYVAIFDGKMVDQDQNELDLAKRVAVKYWPPHLLIRKVVEKEEAKEYRIDTPTLNKE